MQCPCILRLCMSMPSLLVMHRWFEDFDHATWDLAAFYFGNRNDFICEQCVHVESGTGTKWSFLYKFAKSDVFQKKYARQYKQVCHDCWSLLAFSTHKAADALMTSFPQNTVAEGFCAPAVISCFNLCMRQCSLACTHIPLSSCIIYHLVLSSSMCQQECVLTCTATLLLLTMPSGCSCT